MKSRKVCSKSGETSRKSHVKMYKSGKHWVRVVMTRIGLIRLFKGRKEEIRISLSDEAMGEPTLSYKNHSHSYFFPSYHQISTL